jgi:hypothetical protein
MQLKIELNIQSKRNKDIVIEERSRDISDVSYYRYQKGIIICHVVHSSTILRRPNVET